MRNLITAIAIGSVVLFASACKNKEAGNQAVGAAAPSVSPEAEPPAGNLPTNLPPNNIVSIAIASKDHTTFVAALKAADYVTAASATGPLTVFAPTNAAFDKLPKATLDDLMKPANVDKLRNILKYHVTTSVYQVSDLKDGMELGMANGGKVTIHVKDGKVMVNDANIVATIRADNGIIHVLDSVLVPPAK